MGLFDIFKGQFIDIVEWADPKPNVLVHRFERHNNEIKKWAKLIVRPGQMAIFVNEGKVCDRFEPGTYTLDTANLPILTSLLSLPYNFQSWHKAEVYFIRTAVQLDRKWGTPNPVMMRDAELGTIRLRAFGNYSYRVGATDDMLSRFLGGRGEFTCNDVEGQFDTYVVSELSDALGELRIPALDLASQYNEIGIAVGNRIRTRLTGMGFELDSFTVANISLPEEVNEAIDKRSKVGIYGGTSQYAQMEATAAMRDAAKNQGSGGAMMGMMMGANMGGMIGNNMNQAINTPPPVPQETTFFTAVGGQRQGPFTMADLKNQAMNGIFSGDTLVWTAGMANWAVASSVPALAAVLGSVPPPPPMP